jgi:hypothetical protein
MSLRSLKRGGGWLGLCGWLCRSDQEGIRQHRAPFSFFGNGNKPFEYGEKIPGSSLSGFLVGGGTPVILRHSDSCGSPRPEGSGRQMSPRMGFWPGAQSLSIGGQRFYGIVLQ